MGAKVWGTVLLALWCGACGGGPSPADPSSSPTLAPPALPPSLGGGGGAVAPGAGAPKGGGATSPDVARGTKALEAGDLPGARVAFEAALKKDPRDADALASLGVVLERQGDRGGAEQRYRDALKVRPDHEAAALNLSAILVDLERYADALKVAKGALATHSENVGLRTNVAIAFAGQGDLTSAFHEFHEAIARAPNDAMLHITYGHWLVADKQSTTADSELIRGRNLAGNDVGLIAAAGHDLRLNGSFFACIETFDRALRIKDAAELRTERALCKLGQKDAAGALADLQTAVVKEPKYAPAHFYLGGRLAAAGKWREVAEAYETYLRLEPDGPLAAQAKERVKMAKERMSGKK